MDFINERYSLINNQTFILKKVVLHSVATAFASIVFPVPIYIFNNE